MVDAVAGIIMMSSCTGQAENKNKSPLLTILISKTKQLRLSVAQMGYSQV